MIIDFDDTDDDVVEIPKPENSKKRKREREREIVVISSGDENDGDNDEVVEKKRKIDEQFSSEYFRLDYCAKIDYSYKCILCGGDHRMINCDERVCENCGSIGVCVGNGPRSNCVNYKKRPCNWCGKKGHNQRDCPTMKISQSYDKIPGDPSWSKLWGSIKKRKDKYCFKCGSKHHYSRCKAKNYSEIRRRHYY